MTSTRNAFLAASSCMFLYGVIRLIGRMDGQYGPGLDWQLAHFANLAGLLLFLPAVLGVGRELRGVPGRTVAVVGTLIGIFASIVQFVVDIVAGLLASDKADLSRLTGNFQDLPGFDVFFYQFGPQLMYFGLLVLIAMLAWTRKLPWWSLVLVFVGVCLPAVTLNLLPVAAACLFIAYLPRARSLVSA
ncbi:hypothetical protein FPZ12_035565 [Amycolatopsis acidicola]|uniref:DUF4386 domain-containing protein n=1 Tax=Amycolatopsis acidicola TaxID=2596893 RepID=A0A5N0UT91_9PSEU|nr:hypothetical protein [Amycolatopsis acidicola]KAA9153085.1 hypothetical protein FPZ12_035565 [Amycolatopsis acidicola]